MRIRYGGNLQSASARARLPLRREPYWVTLVRGCALGYRRGALGGTWIVRRRDEAGKQHYHAIGPANDLNDGQGLDYREAFEQARRLFGVPSASSSKLTVGDALDRYLAHLRSKNPATTTYDAERRIESILKPALGTVRLAKLTSGELSAFLDELRTDRAPDTVNRIWALLKAALNLAWSDGRIADDTPWRKITATKVRGTARKVHLSAAQAKALLEHAKPAAFAHLMRAALLTGARYGELAGLRVRDLDAASGSLEIASGKTGGRTVFLSQEAVSFFAERAKGRAPDDPLLPKESGGVWEKNHHQKLMVRAVKAAKLDPATVFYSLRHSHISIALLAGVNIQVLAENTGTSVRMIERHYGKFLRQDRRAMFDRLPGLGA
jgi:integrase